MTETTETATRAPSNFDADDPIEVKWTPNFGPGAWLERSRSVVLGPVDVLP
jgi:hypothetical protein